MANNNFKAFAAAAGANVMTQSDYEALAALLTGFVSGTAQSAQLNKVWRQSSIMSAVLAQFIVDLTGQDAIDDGTTATLLANLKTAVSRSGAVVLLQTATVTSPVASIDFTGLADSYKEYIIEICDLVGANNSFELWARFSEAGVWNTNPVYAYTWAFNSSSSAANGTGGSGGQIQILNGGAVGTGLGVAGRICIYSPHSLSSYKRVVWDMMNANGISTARYYGASSYTSRNSIDGIRLLLSNGSIASATVKLYGVN